MEYPRRLCGWCGSDCGSSIWAKRTFLITFSDQPEDLRDETLYFCSDGHRFTYFYSF